MKKSQRIEILKKAQQTTSPTTTTTTTAPAVQQNIDLNQIPGFRRELFNQRPDVLFGLQKLVNIINKYLLTLSGNKVSFNITWNNPSISGSEFHDDVKNLVILSKWILNVIRSKAQPYDLNGLKEFVVNINKTINEYPFSTNIKTELIPIATNMLSLFP